MKNIATRFIDCNNKCTTWCGVLITGEAMGCGEGGIWEPVFSTHFCCEPETALKSLFQKFYETGQFELSLKIYSYCWKFPKIMNVSQVMDINSFLKNFYWSIVGLQCWVSFRCTAKWICYPYTYIHSFLDSFPV